MKPVFDFFVKLCILSVVLWGVIYWGLGAYTIDLRSVFIAWIMVVFNTLSGYLLFEYAFDKESKVFTLAVFGGLAVRLLLLMAVVLIVNLLGLVTPIDFVISFIAFYCIYLIIEILGYQKKNQQKKNAASNG
jgi:ABC-type Co2+ transport system permease subunit